MSIDDTAFGIKTLLEGLNHILMDYLGHVKDTKELSDFPKFFRHFSKKYFMWKFGFALP